MCAHNGFRPVAIGRARGRDHLDVMTQTALQRIRAVVVEVLVDDGRVGDTAQRGRQLGVSRRLDEKAVKASVQLDDRAEVLVLARSPDAKHGLGEVAHLGKIAGVDVRNGLANGVRLQAQAHLEKLVQFRGTPGCHARTAIGLQFDEPLSSQAGERLADRSATDRQATGQLSLPEPRSGCDGAGQDALAQRLHCLIRRLPHNPPLSLPSYCMQSLPDSIVIRKTWSYEIWLSILEQWTWARRLYAIGAAMSTVAIVEVAPRDGLQNEDALVSTDDKLALIDALVASGVRRIEATSFVNPKRVPQLADADDLARRLPRGRVSWIGLVLNERGLDRALDAGMNEVNVVVVATDTFSRRNQGVSTAEGIDAWAAIARRARAAGVRATITVAAAFGCPFEGEVPVDRVAEVVARCVQAQPDELAFADTIGVGVPAQVEALTTVAAREAAGVPLRWHFHNTRNTGYANAIRAAELGAAHGPVALDSSAGGIGGCPFAPNATGNIATEDLLYLLHRSGFRTDLEVSALLPLGERLGTLLGHQVPGQRARAGEFPPS